MPATLPSDAERWMLDSRLVGIVRISDCVIVWCNECFASMFGYSAAELVGRSPGILHPGRGAYASVAERARPVLGRGGIYRVEFPGLRKDGTAGWYEASLESLSTGGDQQIGVCVDVTERRRQVAELQEARADLQAILDNVPARISAWNSDLTNRFANRAAERHFGVGERGALGRQAAEVVGDTRHRESWPYVAAALAGERTLRSAVDPQPDGSVRYSEVAYVPMRAEAGVVGFYVLGSDVTDLHNSYARIRDLARRLETVREDERRVVAQRLHEGIAQDLFAAQLRLERLRSGAAGAAACEAEEHAALAEAIARCLEKIRNLADELWPSALAHLSLVDAISAHARSAAVRTGLEIVVTSDGTVPPLRDPIRFVLFRAAEESLAQLARQPGASRAVIALRCDGQQTILEVRCEGAATDDGRFLAQDAHGLGGTHEHVAAMGGSVTTTGQGGFAGITVCIPLEVTGRMAP